MTKFEQIGVERQQSSHTIKDAQEAFTTSCKVCCLRGLRIECDSCAINHAHDETIAIINEAHEDIYKLALERFLSRKEVAC